VKGSGNDKIREKVEGKLGLVLIVKLVGCSRRKLEKYVVVVRRIDRI
jgi:hypothetical protein